MSKPPPPRLPTKDDLVQLDHFSSLLHLLHHRNQNQHRRSIWYRHFSLFRKHLTALLADYTTLLATPTSAVERTRLKALTPSLHIRISKRLAFWQDVLVARWMRAFSQVVADGRFSVLGLVMLGVLGGVCRVVGVVDGLEAEGQAEIERVLEEFGREAWGDEGGFGRPVGRGEGNGGVVVARAEVGESVARVDEGEVVAREDVDDGVPAGDDEVSNVSGDQVKPVSRKPQVDQSEDDEADEARAISSPPPSPHKVTKPKTTSTKKRPTETKLKAVKKKRKKGGDAIDDLFSGW
jgi:ribonuclease MRP protein subunit RMP1